MKILYYTITSGIFFNLYALEIDKLKTSADSSASILTSFFENSISKQSCQEGQSNIENCNYWKLGNTFDTLIFYFDKYPTDPNNNSIASGNSILKAYPIILSGQNPGVPCWYDDFGWWAVASARALQHPNLWTPDQKENFSQIANDTWAQFQIGHQVWNLCAFSLDCQKTFSTLKPKFSGGVWNYFWFPEKGKPYDNVCNTKNGDPLKYDLTGRQNTVTNGLYANAALMRLNAVPKNLIFLQESAQIHQFLMNWTGLNDKDKSLLNDLSTASNIANAVVVRERVSSYDNDTLDPKYEKDLAWAADQGFLLQEIVLYLNSQLITPEQKQPLLQMAKKILLGSKYYFTNYADKMTNPDRLYSWSHSIHPALGVGTAPGNDPQEYNTGLAVFSRYLTFVYKNNADLKQYMKDIGFPDIFYRAALAAATDNSTLCDSPANCSYLVLFTNKLAVSVAAIEMQDGISAQVK